jgi:endoglucanase
MKGGSITVMEKSSLDFLRQLVNTPSPSGFEAAGQRVWLDYARQFADETFTDAYGNAVAVLNKGGSPRIMLSGHADEIGLMVNYIDANGFIYLRRIGGVDPAITKAQRVVIHTAAGPVRGVVGTLAPHLQKGDGDPKPPKLHELYVDIGCKNKATAEKLVQVGDPITLADEFEVLRGDIAIARGFDNRIGTFAAIEAVRRIKQGRTKIAAEVCAVSNIQEEVGLFGARQIAYSLQPDVALCVDVTHATDVPGLSKEQHGDVQLGHGPAITRGGPNHPEVYARLRAVAKRAKIPLQLEAVSGTSGTDTDAIFWTRGGIPSALVSLPNRYMHSPVEMIHLRDLEQVSELLAAFVTSVKAGEQFKTKI